MEEKAVYVEKQVVKTFEAVSLKEWMITMLILMVPIVNIVMMFVWAFGSETNPSKANYFKAALIFSLILFVLWIVTAGSMIGLFLNMM